MFKLGKNKIVISVFLMIMASAFVALTTIIAKTLGSNEHGNPLNPVQISQSRFLFGFIIIFIIFFFSKSVIRKPNYKLHFARTISGWVGVTILFGASSLMPVSDAMAINFSNPIFAILLAVIFLKEKVPIFAWIGIAITFLGAIILIRPDYKLINYEPIALISLIGAVVLGFEAIFIKLLVKGEQQIQILLINNGIGLIVSSLPLYYFWKDPSAIQIVLCVFIGSFMLIGQFFFLAALKIGNLSFVAPFFYSTLIFINIYDYFIFKTMPDKISLLGSAIIIIGGIIIYIKKNNLSQKYS